MKTTNVNTNAPEFLLNGIRVNGKAIQPLDLSSTGNKEEKTEGLQLLKVLDKKLIEQQKIASNARAIVSEFDFLSKYKSKILAIDLNEVTDFLFTLRPFTNYEANRLKPQLFRLEDALIHIPYLENAITDVKLYYLV